MQRSSDGFTLIELVMVLVILGILAALAMPRFMSRSTFDALTSFDQIKATLRYAQKTAIAQRTPVHVNIAASSIALSYAAANSCAAGVTPVRNPANSQAYVLNAQTGIVITGNPLCFDGLGRPYNADAAIPAAPAPASINVSVAGDGAVRTILIERETGYVY